MEIKLDPELQAVVDATTNPEAPHAADVPIEMLRMGYVMISAEQGLKDVPCDEIRDLEIAGAEGDIGARLYVPAGMGDATSGALVFIHGGGFMIGNLDSHDSVCRQLANHGHCRVVAIDYRLAPEHKFPAAVDDSIAAANWIFENVASLNIDPNRVAVGGDSAGGNLSAVVSHHFAANTDFNFKLQLLIYPATDARTDTESMTVLKEAGVTLDARILEYFNEGYLGGTDADPADPRRSPAASASFANLAPAHVVTAEYDPLRDEGKAYAELLEAHGIPATYRCYEGLMHNFIQQTGVVTSARKAVEDMGAVLKEAVG
ncbi:MAG: alpha/beta hydrolase [Pseudomonadales bacterium]|nr:alpha/beta hydrolase [Pseudomonadales bacterium]